MYELLKNIALDNGFDFTYARRDYANLYNEIEDKSAIYLFLDPVTIDKTFDDYGNTINTTYTGTFMLLKSSEFSDDYITRYLEDIQPLLNEGSAAILEGIGCSGYTINNWRSVEGINIFDWNFDGLIITYNISK